MSLSIQLSRKRVILTLVVVAVVLAILGISLTAYEWHLGVDNTYWVLQASEIFSLNHESNIPTWFSSTLLFSASVLGFIIAKAARQNEDKWLWHWRAFSALFLYLTLDEASALHEVFTTPMRDHYELGGYLYFGWMLVGIPVAILVGLFFLPFVWKLPTHTRMSMIAAAIVYLGGAVGVEAISANEWYQNNGTTLQFSAIGTLEELLEMLGVIILLYGLMTYIARTIGTVSISFQTQKSE